MGFSMWWLLVVGFLVMAGNGYPEEDLVVKLPGQPRVGFKQYVGYIDVDVKVGRSLFYYFVEAEHDPDYKPLTLWLNGGPGCSSIGGGAFTELGPFFPTGDGRGLRRNPKSWNKASNLLFVESPTGVGWSYSNTTSDYTCGDASAAMDMHIFLMKWVEKFPSFKSRDLFLTGESYAGHYIPQLAVALLDHNEHSKGYKFNIKGVAVRKQLPETFAVASIEQPCPIVMRLKRWERKKCKPNSLPVLQKMHVKLGDTVKVISGREKGKIEP